MSPSFLMMLAFSFLLFIWFVGTPTNGATLPPLRAAVIVQSRNSIGEQLVTGFEGSYFDKTTTDRDSNPLPWFSVAGITFASSLANASGELKYKNGDTQPVQLSYFNIGRLVQTNVSVAHQYDTAMQRAQSLAMKLNDTKGVYGAFNFIFTPFSSIRQITAIFFDACESSQSCIAIAPFESANQVYVCVDPLPIDCISRGRGVGDRRFQYGFGALYDPANAVTSHIAYLRYLGARTAAYVMTGNGDLDYRSFVEATSSFFTQKITNVYTNTLAYFNASNLYFSASLADSIVSDVQNANPDFLVMTCGEGYPPSISNFQALMSAFQRANYLPKMIAVGAGCQEDIRRSSTGLYLTEYIMGASNWVPFLQGPAYHAEASSFNFELFPSTSSKDSPQVFTEKFAAAYPISDPFYSVYKLYSQIAAAFGAGSFIIMQKLIELAGSSDPNAIILASNRISAPSIIGRIQFDPYGRLMQSEQIVTQYQSLASAAEYLYPLYLGATPVIYPMPQFSERTYSPSFYGTSHETIVAIVNSVVIAMGLFMALLVFKYRNHAIIKASMFDFCLLVIIGGITMMVSTYFAALHVSKEWCVASVWLLTCGFTLMFSSLFTKTWVVYRIFTGASRKAGLVVIRLGRQMLYSIVIAFLLSDILINLIWTFAGPIDTQIVVVDPYRPSLNYTQCQTTPLIVGCIIASLLVKAIFVLGGMILTFRSRHLPDKFNETVYIGFAVYNVFVLSLFIIPIVGTQVGGRVTAYYIRSFGIMILVLSTYIILFFQKFYLIFMAHVAADAKISTSSNINLNNSNNQSNKTANDSKGNAFDREKTSKREATSSVATKVGDQKMNRTSSASAGAVQPAQSPSSVAVKHLSNSSKNENEIVSILTMSRQYSTGKFLIPPNSERSSTTPGTTAAIPNNRDNNNNYNSQLEDMAELEEFARLHSNDAEFNTLLSDYRNSMNSLVQIRRQMEQLVASSHPRQSPPSVPEIAEAEHEHEHEQLRHNDVVSPDLIMVSTSSGRSAAGNFI